MFHLYDNAQKIIDTETKAHVKEKRKVKQETAKMAKKLKET